jgi:hypothetical protein
MLRLTLPLCTLAVLSTLAIAPINADEPSHQEQLTVVVYPVADLPLYHQNSDQMQPQVLVAFMKSLCHRFDQQGGRVAPHETSPSLVVRTTRANHKRIAEGVESLRRSMQDSNGDKRVSEVPPAAPVTRQAWPIPPLPTTAFDRIEQSLDRQPLQVPMHLEALADRLTRSAVPHKWPTFKEWDVPIDRDYYIGGYRLIR